jgi:hypothetical protein
MPFRGTLANGLCPLMQFVHADEHHHHHHHHCNPRHHRCQGVKVTDPLRVVWKSDATRWSSHDLYKRIDLLTLTQIKDNVAARTLISASFTDTKNMTVESRENFCNGQNFIYAGVEFAQECCKSCFSVVPVSPHIRHSDHTIRGNRLWECDIEWGEDCSQLEVGL